MFPFDGKKWDFAVVKIARYIQYYLLVVNRKRIGPPDGKNTCQGGPERLYVRVLFMTAGQTGPS